jgi:hypothetical protein
MASAGHLSTKAPSPFQYPHLLNPSDGMSFEPLQDDEGRSYVYTSKGPLTKGFGDARLAEPSDVSVTVNGVEVIPESVNAVYGEITLPESVPFGSEVLVSYHWTQNPTLELAEFNTKGYTFNQYAYSNMYSKRFPFDSVFGPFEGVNSPQRWGYQHTAFQRQYSGVFNDPSTMLFNENPHSVSSLPLERFIEPQKVEWLGDTFPSEDGWELFEGTSPLSFVEEDDLFVINDTSMAQDLVTGNRFLYKKDLDLSFDHIALLNVRLKIFSYTKIQDFTGVSVGFSSKGDLYSLGFLEVEGLPFAGLLSDRGDESKWSSYNGIPAKIEPRVVGEDVFWDTVSLDFNPFWDFETKIMIEGDIYEVASDIIEADDGTFKVTLNGTFSSQERPVQVFTQINYNETASYRIFKNEVGHTTAFLTGNPVPFAILPSYEVPKRPEIFEFLGSDTLFFGSLSRQAVSRTGWGFYSFHALPSYAREAYPNVFVDEQFHNFPENSTEPWILIDNQGSSEIVELGADHHALDLDQGGSLSKGTYSYARIEPLLTGSVSLDLRARMRVNSFSKGIPASLTVVDDEKDITLALFSDPLYASDADYAISIVTLGNMSEPQPFSLMTKGLLSEGSLGNIEYQFEASYSGTKPFQDESWTALDLDLSFIDRFVRISKPSGETHTTSTFIPLPPLEPFDEYLFTSRLRINSYEENTGALPFRFGMEDNNIHLSLSFYEMGGVKKLLFTDEEGIPLENGIGDTLSADFDWSGFHTYKVVRFQDSVSLFADHKFLKSFVIEDFPSTSNVQHTEVFLKWNEGSIDLDLDYITAHSTYVGDKKIGLYRGGDLLDKESYELVPCPNWLGSFLEIQLHRNPDGKLTVYLNQEEDPYFDIEYLNLPDKIRRDDLVTDLGFVKFGSLDPSALASTTWDYITYSINSRRDSLLTLPHSAFNKYHSLASYEGYTKEPITLSVNPQYSNKIVLSPLGIIPDKVLSVKNNDSYIPFVFHSDVNEIVLDEFVSPKDVLDILYIPKKPYTWESIQDRESSTQLQDDTPSFEMTHEKELEVVVSLISHLGPESVEAILAASNIDYASLIVTSGHITCEETSPLMTQGLISSDTTEPEECDTLYGSDFEVGFSLTEGILRFTYRPKRVPAYYDFLDLRIKREGTIGESGLIHPVSDDVGLVSMELYKWIDTYNIPIVPSDGLGTYHEKKFTLDDLYSLLDSVSHVMESKALNEAYAHLDWIKKEQYNKPWDQVTLAFIVYLHGMILDKYVPMLDNENKLLDSYSTSEEEIDFTTPINYP